MNRKNRMRKGKGKQRNGMVLKCREQKLGRAAEEKCSDICKYVDYDEYL